MIDRQAAWCLLTEFTSSESLRKHALAVEACMRAYARKFSANEELWGVVGLLHDFDYEKYPRPQEHPYNSALYGAVGELGNFEIRIHLERNALQLVVLLQRAHKVAQIAIRHIEL